MVEIRTGEDQYNDPIAMYPRFHMVILGVLLGIAVPLTVEMGTASFAGVPSSDTTYAFRPLWVTALAGWVLIVLMRGAKLTVLSLIYSLTLLVYFYAGARAGSPAHENMWLIHANTMLVLVCAKIIFSQKTSW